MLLIRLNAPFCADSEDCRTKSLAAARDIVSIGIDLEKTASVVYWELPINVRLPLLSGACNELTMGRTDGMDQRI
jgi:hypothetical protein